MKKTVLIICLFKSFLANGQMTEGRIIFERTLQMPRMFSADPNLADQLPKSRTDQFELLFGNNQSLWQYLPNANTEDPGSFSGNGIVLRFAGGSNEISYHDFGKGIKVDQREVAERNFVVTDSIRKLDWKLTDETRIILGYNAHKAIAKSIGTRRQMTMENGEMKREQVADTSKIIAWYTTEIPVPSGPDFQGQLPGMILQLDMNTGQIVFKAIEISSKVNTNKIKAPKDGKKLTAAEFTKEREKLMEEMRKNMPAGGVMRITN